MTNIDIIILSYAKNEALKNITLQTISTLLASEDSRLIKFNVIVIESNKVLSPFQYPNSRTIYPKQEFGFHKFLNIGISLTQNELICFCNNDLIFNKGWATAILESSKIDPAIKSFNPFCPKFHHGKIEVEKEPINYGYTNALFFTGWCFLVKREIFNSIGLFDERFKFWFCDDDFRLTLEKYRIKNALIRDSLVTHLASKTLSNESDYKKSYFQYISFALYKYKWQHHNFMVYLFELIKYRLKILYAKFG
ncbi:glycosyltransferase family 2 protein [Pedobacter sp. 22226]|uniref:glycosyltransferase family 2 protein n=1 Tax=Pedobacter sp. 22226 TaxID=3453894 RepID=UPI003F843250